MQLNLAVGDPDAMAAVEARLAALQAELDKTCEKLALAQTELEGSRAELTAFMVGHSSLAWRGIAGLDKHLGRKL